MQMILVHLHIVMTNSKSGLIVKKLCLLGILLPFKMCLYCSFTLDNVELLNYFITYNHERATLVIL